jgi:hypothetical protein
MQRNEEVIENLTQDNLYSQHDDENAVCRDLLRNQYAQLKWILLVS